MVGVILQGVLFLRRDPVSKMKNKKNWGKMPLGSIPSTSPSKSIPGCSCFVVGYLQGWYEEFLLCHLLWSELFFLSKDVGAIIPYTSESVHIWK